MSKVKELLSALGIEDEKITAVMAENSEADVAEIAQTVEGIFRDKLSNDEPFKEEIVKPLMSKFYIARQKEIIQCNKDLGIELTEEEIRNLPSTERTQKMYILGLKKAIAKKNDGNETESQKIIEDLNRTIATKDSVIKKYEEEDLPAAQRKADETITSFKREGFLRNIFDQVNRDEKGNSKLVADAEVLYPGVMAKFNELYDSVPDGNGFIPVQKGTTNKVYVSNKPVGLVEVFSELSKGIQKKQDPPGEPRRFKETKTDATETPAQKRTRAAMEKQKQAAGIE